MPKFNSPFDFYLSLGQFFKTKGYFERNISAADYYKAFLEYTSEVLKEDTKSISEIIKFDYLKHNKKKMVTSFFK